MINIFMKTKIDNHFSVDDLKIYLSYNPETGELLRRDKHKGKIIEPGEIRKAHTVMIDWKIVSAAKVAWALGYGAWPVSRVYFGNGNNRDLRLSNLTLVGKRKRRKRHA
jgi:hypothetical protein